MTKSVIDTLAALSNSLRLTAGAILREQRLGFQLVDSSFYLISIYIVGHPGDLSHDSPGSLVDVHLVISLQDTTPFSRKDILMQLNGWVDQLLYMHDTSEPVQ